jgi:ferredoxin
VKTDTPIDFGVTEFCAQCVLCARACPAHAISFHERTFAGPTESNNPGIEKWYVDVEKCLRFWQVNGACCSNCIAACPFTMDFLPSRCLECEQCIAPQCPLQRITAERLKHGYMQAYEKEGEGGEAWERYLERKYFHHGA